MERNASSNSATAQAPPPPLPTMQSARFAPAAPIPPPKRDYSVYAPMSKASPTKARPTPLQERDRDESKRDIAITDNSLSGPCDEIYHKNHFSEFWLTVAISLHVTHFIVLFTMGSRLMNQVELGINVFVVFAVVALLLLGRLLVTKNRAVGLSWVSSGVTSPGQETDAVSDAVIYILAIAALCEGVSFSIYSASAVGQNQNALNASGYYSSSTIIQTLSFATITMYSIHRIIRPANRLDPLRTVLELEAVSVCWDALDGSSLFELYQDQDLSPSIATAVKSLMIFWYLSVGARLAMMFCAHLDPNAYLAKVLLTRPKLLSSDPTVDRSLQGMRLRSVVTLVMALAEFFALGLRVTLWVRGTLDSTQQEMMIKNFLFLGAVSGAFGTFGLVSKKNWNSRYIFGILKKPSRMRQVHILWLAFPVSYVVIGAMFSSYLVHVTGDNVWILNVAFDVFLALIFLFVCRNVYNKTIWVVFPLKLALGLGCALAINMYIARIPGIFYSESKADEEGESWSYNNAMLVMALSVLPIACYGAFWSTSSMMFYPEFTAAPGNYNAIHDPIITLVSVATMVEGALDVVSCSSLMALATNNLPRHINGAIVLFAYLEIVNACQSFAFQSLLSGGHKDTPAYLVRWRANLRIGRGVIDFGALVLRIFLWVEYDALTYVFLIKNLYNILHTCAEIERANIVRYYSNDTLFAQFVRPQDW